MAKKNSKVDETWDRFTKLVANRLIDAGTDSLPCVPQDGEIPLAKVGTENGIGKGLIDAVAFGRDWIANPDLVARLQRKADLNPQRAESFYGGGAEGYTDYPTL